MLARAPLGDPARTSAIRAGLVVGLVGMALAFLMTSPTTTQLADFRGIAGAHTVGLADGGVGIPVLGWSTKAGDLRIPHFVGMHALQVLPLTALLLEALARRAGTLRDPRVRLRIVLVVTALYSALVVVLTAQALGGQSIVRPDALTAGVSVVLWLAAAAAVALVLRGGRPVAPVDTRDAGALVP
jgi:hypothetical protein